MELEVGDATLHVDLAGPEDGPLVLFLHGALASGRAFRGQVPALHDRYRVALPDQRGHGRSTHFAGEPPWAALDGDIMARDALVLMDALSPARAVHVVGVSMGGIVAARAASLAPHRFASISLWSTPPDVDPTWVSFFARTPPDALDARTQRLAALWHGEPYWRSLARGLFACFAEGPRHLFQGRVRVPAALVMQARSDTLLRADDPERWVARLDARITSARPPGDHAFFADGRDGTQAANDALRNFLDEG